MRLIRNPGTPDTDVTDAEPRQPGICGVLLQKSHDVWTESCLHCFHVGYIT